MYRRPPDASHRGQAVEWWLRVVVLDDTTRERYEDHIRLSPGVRGHLGSPVLVSPSRKERDEA